VISKINLSIYISAYIRFLKLSERLRGSFDRGLSLVMNGKWPRAARPNKGSLREFVATAARLQDSKNADDSPFSQKVAETQADPQAIFWCCIIDKHGWLAASKVPFSPRRKCRKLFQFKLKHLSNKSSEHSRQVNCCTEILISMLMGPRRRAARPWPM